MRKAVFQLDHEIHEQRPRSRLPLIFLGLFLLVGLGPSGAGRGRDLRGQLEGVHGSLGRGPHADPGQGAGQPARSDRELQSAVSDMVPGTSLGTEDGARGRRCDHGSRDAHAQALSSPWLDPGFPRSSFSLERRGDLPTSGGRG